MRLNGLRVEGGPKFKTSRSDACRTSPLTHGLQFAVRTADQAL